MLTILRATGELLAAPDSIPPDTTWIDLLDPTPAEEALAEAVIGVDLPTRGETRRNEVSSHLFERDGNLFMTTTALADADGVRPRLTTVTFVLTAHCLVSVRYHSLRAFDNYRDQAQRKPHTRCGSAILVLFGLMEAVVERLAEVMEQADEEIDRVSVDVFSDTAQTRRARRSSSERLEAALKHVGRKRTVVTRARESLLTVERLLGFLEREDAVSTPQRLGRLAALQRDARSLGEHAAYVAGNVAFLTDATLGLVGLEQNKIIKIFTVVSVLFMPPTLVGTVYGMNFDGIPELHWRFGYVYALVAMVLSAVIPFFFFRHRRWF